jgi:hypothetical protein
MKKLAILIAAMALVCFSVPAMAVDWNFYGSARIETWYTSQNNPGGTDVDGLRWDLQGNSRLGAKIKAEAVNARIELAVSESNVSTRRIFAVWNFGAGKLKVGKDYTEVDQFISGQVADGDLGLLGVGTQYGSRKAQLGLEFGGFAISFSQLEGSKNDFDAMTEGEGQHWIPRINAKWGMSFDTWNFGIQGGYNTFSIKDAQGVIGEDADGEDILSKEKDVDVDSYTIGGNVGTNFGPIGIKAAASYGQNWGNAGWGIPGNHNGGSFAWWEPGSSNTKDVESWQAALVGSFKLSDMVSFEVGGGYREDNPDKSGQSISHSYSLYGQSVIALAPGVYIIPEVSYFAEGTKLAGKREGNTTWVGAKWQIDF